MNYKQYISADPDVLGGKPRIANTRISVGLILEQLSLGDTIENLLDEHDLRANPRSPRFCLRAYV